MGTSEEGERRDSRWKGDLTCFYELPPFQTLAQTSPHPLPLLFLRWLELRPRAFRMAAKSPMSGSSSQVSISNFTPSFPHRTEDKPSIFLPRSWNCFLFFLSSSSIFWRSSTSCCRRFRASASRSALERNLGFKTEGNG